MAFDRTALVFGGARGIMAPKYPTGRLPRCGSELPLSVPVA